MPKLLMYQSRTSKYFLAALIFKPFQSWDAGDPNADRRPERAARPPPNEASHLPTPACAIEHSAVEAAKKAKATPLNNPSCKLNTFHHADA